MAHIQTGSRVCFPAAFSARRSAKWDLFGKERHPSNGVAGLDVGSWAARHRLDAVHVGANGLQLVG